MDLILFHILVFTHIQQTNLVWVPTSLVGKVLEVVAKDLGSPKKGEKNILSFFVPFFPGGVECWSGSLGGCEEDSLKLY